MRPSRPVLTAGSVELAFSHARTPRLERISYSDPFTETLGLTVRGKSSNSRTFPWTNAVRAMSVLLLRNAALKFVGSKIPHPTLSGSEGSLAASLSEALVSNSRWLNTVFGSAPDGRPFYKDIFRLSESRSPYTPAFSISIDRAVLPAQSITILCDECQMSDPDELNMLADRIEKGSKLSLCTSEILPKPLLSSTSPTSPNALCDDFQRAWKDEIPPSLLNVARLALNDPSRKSKISNLLSSLSEGVNSDLWLHLRQHTEVRIKNRDGDGRVKFSFEAVNVSLGPVSGRTHRFWFERPQPSMKFRCTDDRNVELGVEMVKSSPHFYELRVEFPHAIAPLEKFNYELCFETQKAFRDHRFYFVAARTITNRLGMSVVGHENLRFDEAFVANESFDGFLKDNAPHVSVSQTDSVQTLHWEVLHPTPGDIFKTFWSYKQDSGRPRDSVRNLSSSGADRMLRSR